MTDHRHDAALAADDDQIHAAGRHMFLDLIETIRATSLLSDPANEVATVAAIARTFDDVIGSIACDHEECRVARLSNVHGMIAYAAVTLAHAKNVWEKLGCPSVPDLADYVAQEGCTGDNDA